MRTQGAPSLSGAELPFPSATQGWIQGLKPQPCVCALITEKFLNLVPRPNATSLGIPRSLPEGAEALWPALTHSYPCPGSSLGALGGSGGAAECADSNYREAAQLPSTRRSAAITIRLKSLAACLNVFTHSPFTPYLLLMAAPLISGPWHVWHCGCTEGQQVPALRSLQPDWK